MQIKISLTFLVSLRERFFVYFSYLNNYRTSHSRSRFILSHELYATNYTWDQIIEHIVPRNRSHFSLFHWRPNKHFPLNRSTFIWTCSAHWKKNCCRGFPCCCFISESVASLLNYWQQSQNVFYTLSQYWHPHKHINTQTICFWEPIFVDELIQPSKHSILLQTRHRCDHVYRLVTIKRKNAIDRIMFRMTDRQLINARGPFFPRECVRLDDCTHEIRIKKLSTFSTQ